jgi:hypothetical protein
VKVGDLVKCWGTKETGIIVEITDCPVFHEIVVMLPCGTMWHADPTKWEVINESR